MCLAVVFLPLIEKELQQFMHYWNTHCIRQSNGNCVGGIPDDLHDMPQHCGIYNYYNKLLRIATMLVCSYILCLHNHVHLHDIVLFYQIILPLLHNLRSSRRNSKLFDADSQWYLVHCHDRICQTTSSTFWLSLFLSVSFTCVGILQSRHSSRFECW